MNLLVRVSRTRLKHLALMVAIASTLLTVLPSCKLPKLNRAQPGAALPETFNGEISAESSAQIDLHQFFDDPMLTSLIDQAMFENQELKILDQEIQIARNEVMSRRGDYLPFISFGALAGLEKSSEYSREGAVEEHLKANGRSFPDPLPEFLVGANVSWEIDIWKKLRNAQRAAALRYLGTADGRTYVATRLIAEIAENYYDLLALDQRLQTLDRTISLQEQSLEVAKANKAAARGTELAVQRFQAEVHKNQSEKLIIAQEIIEAENRINFLAGRFPQGVDRSSVDFINLNVSDIRVGVPAQLLQNRADIREAERELAAAGLDVRVARANFYPSLTINAGIGYQAFNPKYLFLTPESLIYNLAGDIVAPLVNRNAIKAEYLNANARQLQSVYDYQRTVLDAFTEVINSISKVDNYGRSLDIKKQQLESLETSVEVASNLFQTARAEYMDVLLSQRDLQEAKVEVIETKRQQLIAVVNAYQALGGGGAPASFTLGMEVDASELPSPVESSSDEFAPVEFAPVEIGPVEMAPVEMASDEIPSTGATPIVSVPEEIAPVISTPEAESSTIIAP